MQEINEILRKYDLKPKKYTKNKNIYEIETENGKYILKLNNSDHKIFEYLKTRNFDYFPYKINTENEKYELTRYILQYEIPEEQKILDLIELVSLLHNKTTHYKEVTKDAYKEIYEDLNNNINHLYAYYTDLITMIENKIFMSPSEYLIARNISKIYASLNFSHELLEKWYNSVKEKKKERLVVLHNNLDLSHFIVSDKNYLTSWNKSKIGIPIFDIYKLYLNHGLDMDFNEIFKKYEKNYPLYDDERTLFFILISIPPKIELNKTEYENTKSASKKIDYIYKTEQFISPYNSNKREENKSHKQEN